MPVTATLRIVQTSDVHMHVLPYDYFRNAPDPYRGLARAAGIIKAARAQGTTLLFDTGDLLQGTPMAALFRESAPATHPACKAIDDLGYDAVTLGNHDFNFGLETAQRLYGGMPCPVVQSNVRDLAGAPLFAPTVILKRTVIDTAGDTHPIKIGLLGVLPPQVLEWDHNKLNGRITVIDMVKAARHAARSLREQGADLIVALAHTAPASEPQPDGAENRAHDIAALPDIDVVLAGHSHRRLPAADYDGMPGVDSNGATLAGTPAMMPGANASHIGRMDLTLEHTAAGWQIAGHNAELIALKDRPASATLNAALASEHDRTTRFVTQEVATTRTPISGRGFAFGFDAGQVLMADAARWRVEQEIDLQEPLIVATAPYRVETAPDGLCLHPGPISRCDLFTLYPYPNETCVVRVTGAALKDWLEHAACVFAAHQTDVVGPLLDPAMPSYNFDTLHGLNYRIDLFGPKGDRIRDLTRNGAPVTAGETLLMATSTYRANGGGQFPKTPLIWADTIPITQMIERYLEAHGSVAPDAALGWEFVPHEGQATLLPHVDDTRTEIISLGADNLQTLAQHFELPYMRYREVGAGEHLANPVRSGRKQP